MAHSSQMTIHRHMDAVIVPGGEVDGCEIALFKQGGQLLVTPQQLQQ